MTEPTAPARDYRSTVFLPKTDFPMKAGLPQKEPGILARWLDGDLYHQLRAARAGREQFIFHDGPPYANGDMHIGHALNHILKDMVCRTQSLLGKDAPYVPGWDCHGLPIEWKVEEQYRKKKLDKDQVDPVEFRAECRAYAQHWVDVQREQLKRLGVLGNWDKPYLTMDPQAEGTIVSELLKFAESGQLYRGAKPVMWSPVEKTALAEAEVEYEDIVSTQIDVAFEIVESPIAELVGAHAVIWTTTPWTIPVNQALAYGPEVEYTLLYPCIDAGSTDKAVPQAGTIDAERIAAENGFELDGLFLVATELIDSFVARLNAQLGKIDFSGSKAVNPSVVCLGAQMQGRTRERYKGSELAGTIARHPMANHLRQPVLDTGLGFSSGAAPEGSQAPDQVRGDGEGMRGDEWERMVEFFNRPRPFLPGDFVTTESGTGLVHMAPDHGEDDFALCKANGLEPVFAVEADGKYRADWAWLGGQGSVINPKFNAPDGPICEDLRAAGGLLAASADYKHSYPHSWRSKAKVIYRCTPQWFVPMDKEITPPSALRAATSPFGSAKCEGPDPSRFGAAQTGRGTAAAGGGGGVSTLRETAMAAIAATRFVPEKGRNRLGSMVEGRPDWVLSRQRAWGVPITLFVAKGTNQYLCDPAVNARIIAAVTKDGVDAWSDARAQEYLGSDYRAEDYERVTDILDVWFDSGCTHVFTLESGRWPELTRPSGYDQPPADLYLEGSDQHRGWFQSSLLESCATRGRAPYKAVLTHGFTMDQKGMKMSKSLGNTVDPLKVMETYGADIVRLWALSVDFTEDHRIGDEILKGVADQYRKLRNTFRYLLGALDGFSDAERVEVEAMPELERYVVALLAQLDATLKQAVADYDFNTYVRALTDFCNEDLSAFFFDIRKDSLYCDAADDPKRMAYRTVLDTLFHSLVRYAAPVLVFTAEEVWGTRFADAGSVHLLEWPVLPVETTLPRHPGLDPGSSFSPSAAPEGSGTPDQVRGDGLVGKWTFVRDAREFANGKIEGLRQEKQIGSSLQAIVEYTPAEQSDWEILESVGLAEIFICAEVILNPVDSDKRSYVGHTEAMPDGGTMTILSSAFVHAKPTSHHKCGRCWRHLPEVSEDGALCSRCDQVVSGMEAAE